MSLNFRQQVIALVRQVPEGKLVSYGQVARVLGRPRASRVVGGIMASLDVGDDQTPWHRVVNRKGGISSRQDLFSERDPVTEQAERLHAEGLSSSVDGTYDLKEYGVSDEFLAQAASELVSTSPPL